MIEITTFPNQEEFELPDYNEPGRILFRFFPAGSDDCIFNVEIIDYDGCAFWLNEGGFADYTIKDLINLELEGFYVLDNVRGYTHRDYFGEYDEEWEFEYCRRASEQEIETQALQ